MIKFDIQNPDHSPEARANRLKEARKFSRLSLKEMTDTGLINYNTLCGWESGKHGGLTEKGAQKVVERLDQASVRCSVEWLLYDVGEKPCFVTPIALSAPPVSAKKFIEKQIEILKALYPDFIGVAIEDTAMAPDYNIGDFVYGIPLPNEKIMLANGKNIIVHLENDLKKVRKLLFDRRNGSLMLVTHDPFFYEPILQNVTIKRWSLVLCHLRHESLYD